MKIDILFKKDEEEDLKKAVQIAKIVQEAAETINTKVEINLTNDFRAFSRLATNFPLTPVVVINNHLEFAGNIPDLEKVKEKLRAYLEGDTSLMEWKNFHIFNIGGYKWSTAKKKSWKF